jgi:hypothetical protein
VSKGSTSSRASGCFGHPNDAPAAPLWYNLLAPITVLPAAFEPVLATTKPITKERFLREVVPALRRVPAAQIAAAVGLSEAYCAKNRAGRGLPKQKHWDGFVGLA